MQLNEKSFDVVVERAVAGSPAEFVAKCSQMEVEGFGASKAEAVDACEKAILAKLLAPKVVPVVEAVPEPAPKKSKA